MSQYLRSALGPTPQSEPLAGQVANSAGGHSFPLDKWSQLDRFLILGSEGGTYYVAERKLTQVNLAAVKACIAEDGLRVLNRVVEISDSGRAIKNDPAILVLALCLKTGTDEVRKAAQDAVPRVCRIGTHLYHLAGFVNELGGWGRGTRRAFAKWFQGAVDDVAYQTVKYQSRDGWSARDLLRLSHPKAPSEDHARLYRWITKGAEGIEGPLPRIVEGFEIAKGALDAPSIVRLIHEYSLPREAIPTQYLADKNVWAALSTKMPLHATVRNLATMTKIGLLVPGSAATAQVAARITGADALRKSRLHPMAILIALKTYQQGHGDKGKATWVPVPDIVDALDQAFYASFGNVEPTGKSTMLALDISMSMNDQMSGTGLTAMEGAVAMAMVTAAVEKHKTIVGFDTGLIGLDISPRRRLDDNLRALKRNGGGTDCALPMVHALANRGEIDTFCVYTDSETWAGRIHPSEALKKYRRGLNKPDARLVVVGMVSNGFTIADPTDRGMLDVVGFDTATPNIISSFSRGDL